MIEIKIQKGVDLLKIVNEDSLVSIPIGKDQVLMIFKEGDKAFFNSSELNINQSLESDKIYTYANPFNSTSVQFDIESNTEVYLLIMNTGVLHSFFDVDFGQDKSDVSSFVSDYRMKKFITEKDSHPSLKVILYQVFNSSLQGISRELFNKGKMMEFMSVYVHNPSRKEEYVDTCPFVEDHLEMDKIREARKIITQRYNEPPSLKELAKEVGTNEFKLKVGFKSLYGSTVMGYLTDYRLETARKMLETAKHSIKEISHQIGYSNPSHFIAYYKKKFGVTPKQYLKGARI